MATPIANVKPGDLITSDLMNQIITLLNLHDSLLGSTGAAVTISQVLPPVARVGEEIKAFGSGLETTNLTSISVEGTNVPLNFVKLGSSGSLLVIDVPPLLVPPSGKPAVVTVQGKSGVSAFGSFFVLPAIVANLEASFNIKRTTVSPAGVLAANTNYDFTFAIEAFSSLDETYLLDPKLVGAPAGWTVTAPPEMFIAKSQPTPSTTPVVVQVHTGAAGGGTLTLGLRGKNFPGTTGSSLPDELQIGVEPGAPNLNVEFLSPVPLGSVQKFANGSLYIRSTDPSPTAIVDVNVRLVQPGIYNIGAPVVGDPTAWAVTLLNSPAQFNTTGTPNKIETVSFQVVAQPGASDDDLEIPVNGQGALPDGSFKCKVKLRTNPSNPIPA